MRSNRQACPSRRISSSPRKAAPNWNRGCAHQTRPRRWPCRPPDSGPRRMALCARTVGASPIDQLPDGITGSHISRSEEHTSELQSLMRISYAVFCLKKKNKLHTTHKYKEVPTLQYKTQ